MITLFKTTKPNVLPIGNVQNKKNYQGYVETRDFELFKSIDRLARR